MHTVTKIAVLPLFMFCLVSYTLAEIANASPQNNCESLAGSTSQVDKQEQSSIPYEQDTLTLGKALSLALLNNPLLKAYSYEIRVAEAKALQAGLLPNPELEVEIEEVGGGGDRSGFGAAETTIAVGQLIELADKAKKRVKLATLDSELAEWDYKTKRLDIFTNVAHAFVEVLGAQKRLALNVELVKLSEGLLQSVSQKVATGKDPPIERTKAEVLKAKVEIQHDRAAQQLQAARKRLVAFWSCEEPKFTTAKGQLDSMEPVPAFKELKARIANNPDIIRWQTELERADAKIDLEKARRIPDVTLRAGLQRFNETDDNAFVMGFSVPLPLFDRNQGNILAARNNKLKARMLKDNAQLQVYSELADSYGALSSSYVEAVKTRENVVKGARAAFETAMEAYEYGKTGNLDVLDAQRTLFDAEASYIDSLVSYHKAKTDVERLTGQPIQTTGTEKQK